MSIEKMNHRLIPYGPLDRKDWDRVADKARNGHFMFRRDFMEYHADRIADASYLLRRGRKLVALLPAHVRERTLVSHGGLSFGGWVQAPGCRHVDLVTGFDLLRKEMKRLGLGRLIYSPSPYPYHLEPCDDDLFLLQTLGAKCSHVKLAAILSNSAIERRTKRFSQPLRRAESLCPGHIEETGNVDMFWEGLTTFLKVRHKAQPVHSAEEMKFLRNRFPKNIRMFVFRQSSETLAGELVFLSRNALRFQYGFYLSENPQACLSFRLQEWIRLRPDMQRPWIDLGTSMDPMTGELNLQLHLNKENFGAHGVLMQTWTWEP